MSQTDFQDLIKTQNETISDLLFTTRECVNLCHTLMNRLQADDLKRERLLNGKQGFKNETRIKGEVWQDAARKMYLEQNQRASDISEILMVPYGSVHYFLKKIDGYPIKKHGSRIREANYSHRDKMYRLKRKETREKEKSNKY